MVNLVKTLRKCTEDVQRKEGLGGNACPERSHLVSGWLEQCKGAEWGRMVLESPAEPHHNSLLCPVNSVLCNENIHRFLSREHDRVIWFWKLGLVLEVSILLKVTIYQTVQQLLRRSK